MIYSLQAIKRYTSSLAAAILNVLLPVTSDSIDSIDDKSNNKTAG